MNHRAIIISISLFVIIVAGMFGFAYLKKAEIAKQNQETLQKQNQQQQQTPVPYPDVTVITAKHYFIDGVHTLVGELPLPTPCDLLETKSSVTESTPQQIVFNFTVINTAATCEQKITNQRFQVSATAGKDATYTAVFMGRPVQLNIIPAAPGEKPQDFELFIKG